MARAVNFFGDLLSELEKYHETKRERDLTFLFSRARPNLYYYARKLVFSYPMIDADDLVQEALLKALKYIEDYRYLCPKCEGRYYKKHFFESHTERKHGCKLQPVKRLDHWVSFPIRQSMLNTRLKYLRTFERELYYGLSGDLVRRKVKICHDSVTNYCSEFYKDRKTPESKLIFTDLVSELKKKFQDVENKKLRYFIERVSDFVEPELVFQEMANLGLSKTPRSAKETVRYHFKTNSTLRKYGVMLLAG